jgi:hypothetical protein
MSFNAKLLVAVAVGGFGVLHVVGGTMLQYASSTPPIETTIPIDHRD